MITLESLSYRHAGAPRPSLRDVSLELHDGEVLGVAGANEAGKTTLCLVLSGLAPRAIGGRLTGRMLVDGAETSAWRMHEMSEHVGIAFDQPSTQISGVAATVYEEIAFGPANLGLPRDEVIDRTEGALESLGLAELAARDPRRLSGGQQQLVAVASILAMRPRHIVLDEPTAQLDPAGTELVGEAIARLAGQGIAVLLVEHKTDLLARVADRVLVMRAGSIVLEGSTATVLGDPGLGDLGVAEPAEIRLHRAVAVAGLEPITLPAGVAP
jgi:energy-coupling factor transporter ATP-binding protein EcfA2